MTPEEAMQRLPPIWVIYDHPLDFPEYFVVRRWYGEFTEARWFLSPDIERARQYAIDQGASAMLMRDDNDDPGIIETWV